MPKLKTKSSAKKRFKMSAGGKIISPQANKQHNMRKRSKRQIRQQRGTTILPAVEAKRVVSLMPYIKK
jgi:large subunit ribosomal protein L35